MINLADIEMQMASALDALTQGDSLGSLSKCSLALETLANNITTLGLVDVPHLKKFTWTWTDRTRFWKSFNDTFKFVIQCAQVQGQDWLLIRESFEGSAQKLFVYGLIDYDLGLKETELIDAIHSRLIHTSE